MKKHLKSNDIQNMYQNSGENAIFRIRTENPPEMWVRVVGMGSTAQNARKGSSRLDFNSQTDISLIWVFSNACTVEGKIAHFDNKFAVNPYT